MHQERGLNMSLIYISGEGMLVGRPGMCKYPLPFVGCSLFQYGRRKRPRWLRETQPPCRDGTNMPPRRPSLIMSCSALPCMLCPLEDDLYLAMVRPGPISSRTRRVQTCGVRSMETAAHSCSCTALGSCLSNKPGHGVLPCMCITSVLSPVYVSRVGTYFDQGPDRSEQGVSLFNGLFRVLDC